MKYQTIEKYGVILHRLTKDKIEMVRHWRNDPKIQQYMFYREHITSEMQQRWFDSINNDNNYYYIIEIDGKEIGLTNIKDIDWGKKEGETGIFIYNDNYRNGFTSYCAKMAVQDFAFYELELTQTISHVLGTNKRCLKFLQSFGVEVTGVDNATGCQFLTLTKEAYLNSKAVKKITQTIPL